jgi:predicted RNA-binding protein with PIN domain
VTGEPDQGPEVPDRLRQRIVQLVADALPALAPLPPALRRVADFAPARRARLGGGAVWEALADEEFRVRAGTQAAVRVGPEPDAVDAAALAWLSRGDDWTDVVADAVRRLAERDEQRQQASGEIDRLRAQVASLQAELRDQRAAAREPLEEAKAENTLLRRRLGETRAALRAVEAERDQARAELEEAVDGAAAAMARAEAEAKRLREQLDEVSAGLSVARRDARSDRDLATVRARYLLDTVLEAAAGLRRELALPAIEGAPGDAVEAELDEPRDSRTTANPTGSPALDQMLSLPRARLVIDGYNVTKKAWGTATLEAQRSRLVAALAPLVARTGAETTVVFDAAASTTRTAMPAPRGVKVAFSPPGVIADDVVRQLVSAEPRGRVVVVVSDDQEVARDVRRAGARAVSADALLGLLGS